MIFPGGRGQVLSELCDCNIHTPAGFGEAATVEKTGTLFAFFHVYLDTLVLQNSVQSCRKMEVKR